MTTYEDFEAALFDNPSDPSNPNTSMNCIQEFHYVSKHQKTGALMKLLQDVKAQNGEKCPRVAIFCGEYEDCLKPTLALNSRLKIPAVPLCKATINQFNAGEVSVLFITNEREKRQKIDFTKFDLLINYDMPKDLQTYFYRMNKVCAERNAKYITFAEPENDKKLLADVTKTLGVTLIDIFESLSSFSTNPILLPCNNNEKSACNDTQHGESVIRSFEADVTDHETDSVNETTDDSNVSTVIRNAADAVGNEINGIIGDIADAFCEDVKIALTIVTVGIVVFLIAYPFHC